MNAVSTFLCMAFTFFPQVEFIRSHMMKRFPHELYGLCLSIVHRLLAYEKRFRVRLTYPWKELWTALIGLIKFVTSNESSLGKKINLFSVALQVKMNNFFYNILWIFHWFRLLFLQTTVIFNLFITYGDTFLPSPSSYDELYYELVRCHSTFDSLYSMALRYSTGGGEFKVITFYLCLYAPQWKSKIPWSTRVK
jgi:hypothetical protein